MSANVHVATNAQDFEAFRDLIIEYEQSLPPDLRHSDLRRDLEDLEDRYSMPNAAFIATVDDRPGGCVALVELDPTTQVIKKMYVRPAFRNLGLARSLVSALIDFARKNGRARLVLDTDKTRLAAAYKLYLSFGFKECAPYGQVEYACPTYMELSLA